LGVVVFLAVGVFLVVMAVMSFLEKYGTVKDQVDSSLNTRWGRNEPYVSRLFRIPV
jgi:hypothetical protein